MTDLTLATTLNQLVLTPPPPARLVLDDPDAPQVLAIGGAPVTLLVQAQTVGLLVAPAAQGPKGTPGGSYTYAYAFGVPSMLWTIAHNLDRFPSVTIVDTAGDQALADVTYGDANTIRVAFGAPTAGTAYLN